MLSDDQMMIQGSGCTMTELVGHSIALLREHEPPEGYYGCFSGGKDSCVIKELARLADVKVDWHYNVTTVDPPELTRFIRQHHPDVQWDRPERTMYAEVLRGGRFPTRRVRWCCKFTKERFGVGRVKLFGIRAEESKRRAALWSNVSRDMYTGIEIILPIFGWLDTDVWRFIRETGIPYCSLYDEGFTRLGCVLCPMGSAKQKQVQMERWPKIAALWRRAFRELWDSKGDDWTMKQRFTSADEMFAWWVSDESIPPVPCGQTDLKDLLF